ncbi:hypothetical protein [Shewanella sp. 1180_01]|uniref:hypothetical protein n=1 Tax=Shewanella sp. 1180_01 TaxID=2604451 RepID=UPI0040638431
MSTQDTAALIESVNNMTATVAGKMGQIDKKVADKIAEVNGTMNNLFLDSRFGIQPSNESISSGSIPGTPAVFTLPIFTFDVSSDPSFSQGSFVVDIFASGATTSTANWFRQLHVSWKQQHVGFTYNIKCMAQNGLGAGVVSMSFYPNGGQFGAGQLKIWVSSAAGYNTLVFVARGYIGRYNAALGISSNDRGTLHFRKEEAVLNGSAQHDAIKALPNYTNLDI